MRFCILDVSDERLPRERGATYLWIFGRTDHGESVAVRVWNFFPFLYTPLPDGCTSANVNTDDITDELNRFLAERERTGYMKRWNRAKHSRMKPVVSVNVETKRNIMGFNPPKQYLCITVSHPSFIPMLRGALTKGEVVSHVRTYSRQTFNSDFAYNLLYCVETGYTECKWLEIDDTRVTPSAHLAEETTCEFSYDLRTETHKEALRLSDSQGDEPIIRILSFDIEVANRPGVFPVYDQDPVIMIASYVVLSTDLLTPLRYCLHTWRDATLPLPNSTVNGVEPEYLESADEESMLEAFFEYIASEDPDWFTGYNTISFDIPYIAERAKHLGLEWYALGKLRNVNSTVQHKIFQSNQSGSRHQPATLMPGRINGDMIVPVRRSEKLRSYKLDYVCWYFLSDPHYYESSINLEGIDIVRITGGGDDNRFFIQPQGCQPCGPFREGELCHIEGGIAKGSQVRIRYEKPVREHYVFMRLYRTQDNDTTTMYDFTIADRAASEHQKTGVTPGEITPLWESDANGRRRLAIYCCKDAWLPLLLMSHLRTVEAYVQMARVTCVTIDMLFLRGEGIKTTTQVYRFCKTEGSVFIIPFRDGNAKNREKREQQRKRSLMEISDGSSDVDMESDGKFQGATVIEPKRGYYKKFPVSTLDFSSLYPSIMLSNNLCPSTNFDPSNAEQVAYLIEQGGDPKTDVICSPAGHHFVKKRVCVGVLPKILDELLAARKQAKRDMAAATSDRERRNCDCRQLALKISANSVYGFSGARVGKMYYLAVPESVTAFGREALELTIRVVRQYYPEAEIVYGDTDSVFVRFYIRSHSVAESMRCGRHACELVNEAFRKINPDTRMNLEFEKAFLNLLLLEKKKYGGLFFTQPDKPDKVFSKGIETARRDNALITKQTMDGVLHLLWWLGDKEGAKQLVRIVISKLYRNEVPFERLVVSKELKQVSEDYKSAQGHADLANRMVKRDATTAPQLGDRVPYIITAGYPGQKVSERFEDPEHARKNNIQPDAKYYVQTSLERPLRRILEPILDKEEVDELFNGEHTRVRRNTIPSNSIFAQFVTKKPMPVSTPTPGEAAEVAEVAEPASLSMPKPPAKKPRARQNTIMDMWRPRK